MSELHRIFIDALLNSTVRSVTPNLLGGLGGLLCARVDVLNLVLEGS